jgi:hypothetical protein
VSGARDLLRDAWRMIVADWPATLRLVLVPWLIMTGFEFGFQAMYFGYFAGELRVDFDAPVQPGNGPLYGFLASLCVSTLCWVWIAVGWHRYMLGEEVARSWLPRWQTRRILRYFGKALWTWLPLAPVIFVFFIVAAVFFDDTVLGTYPEAALDPERLLSVGFFILLLNISFLRIGLVLPAAAMDHRMTLRSSWRLTRGQSGIWGVALALSLFYVLLSIPVLAFAANNLLYAIFYAVSEIVSLLGLGVLTTLYARLVKGPDV